MPTVQCSRSLRMTFRWFRERGHPTAGNWKNFPFNDNHPHNWSLPALWHRCGLIRTWRAGRPSHHFQDPYPHSSDLRERKPRLESSSEKKQILNVKTKNTPVLCESPQDCTINISFPLPSDRKASVMLKRSRSSDGRMPVIQRCFFKRSPGPHKKTKKKTECVWLGNGRDGNKMETNCDGVNEGKIWELCDYNQQL